MNSPPSIRRMTRRVRNSTSNRNNRGVSRRLFNNNNNNNNITRRLFGNNSGNNNGIRNNPEFVSMERTPNRIVNQYTNEEYSKHMNRVKRRSVIERREREERERINRELEEFMEKRDRERLLKKGTPTKSEERKSRKRARTPNRNNNNNT